MWLDKVAVRNIVKLRDTFGIRYFVETGSAEGTNAIFYSRHFGEVHTCEVKMDLVKTARERAVRLALSHVFVYPLNSPDFLRLIRTNYEYRKWEATPLFFLDAHSPGRWPILEELEALAGFRRCCIVIHDFKVPDSELGHITYGGQDLNLDYVRERLFAVNPQFVLYHNTRKMSEIWTKEEVERGDAGMPWDKDTRWQLDYTWSAPLKTYRGVLYAVPKEVEGLEAVRWILD